mmetsp:Transcript_44010/g.102931  ORF Transcript_44010/g.102931 Transcript_44010/m.102931 type:complete len:122 (-) Transcript_44010:281-646(-)
MILHAAFFGLGGSLPMASVPRVADVIGPLLGLHSWRQGGRLQEWAYAALQGVPTCDGVPNDETRSTMLRLLLDLPDVCHGGAIHLDLLERLREAVIDFARVCRCLQNAHDFTVAAYDWVEL